jgi:hypothetical protein
MKTPLTIKISCFFFLFLIPVAGFSQYYSKQNGNWSSTSSWQTAAGGSVSTPPTSLDDVIIQAGHNITLDASYSCRSLTIIAPPSDGTSRLTMNNKALTIITNLELHEGSGPANTRIAQIDMTSGMLIVNGNFTFTVGNSARAALNATGAATITLKGNAMYSAALGSFYAGRSTLNYNNSGNQTIFPFSYYNLRISGSGTKRLMDNTKILSSGTLYLDQGVLDLNGKTLTVENMAASAITRVAGYILSEDVTLTGGKANNNSKISWYLKNDDDVHVYPFGNTDGVYIPVSVTPPASGNVGYITISTFRSIPANTPFPLCVNHVSDVSGADNSANTVDRFWQISSSSPTPEALITFTYDENEKPANGEMGADNQGLRAQLWDAPSNYWNSAIPDQAFDPMGNTLTVSLSSGNFTSGAGNPSTWTLALGMSPLPVELVGFNVKLQGDKVKVMWTTVVELNNDYFTVERSADGRSYEPVAYVKGKEDNFDLEDYYIEDANPLPGVSYYRLKQTDYNGQVEYFPPMEVLNVSGSLVDNFRVSRNSSYLDVAFTSSSQFSYTIKIYDIAGQEFKSFNGFSTRGTNNLEIPASELSSGVYIITFLPEDQRAGLSKKVSF